MSDYAANLVTPLPAQQLTDVRPTPTAKNDLDADTPAAHKLLKSAQEFEAMLISSLWQEMEDGLKDFSGGELDSGSDTLQKMGISTVAQAMASSGKGIGIAAMIYRSLAPALSGEPKEVTK
jgi:Rod binding domain-containing protein